MRANAESACCATSKIVNPPEIVAVTIDGNSQTMCALQRRNIRLGYAAARVLRRKAGDTGFESRVLHEIRTWPRHAYRLLPRIPGRIDGKDRKGVGAFHESVRAMTEGVIRLKRYWLAIAGYCRDTRKGVACRSGYRYRVGRDNGAVYR